MRVAVLGQGVSGYVEAELVALSKLGAEVFVTTPKSMSDTAFELSELAQHAEISAWATPPTPQQLCAAVDRFDPHVVLAGSFGKLPAHRAVLRSRRPEVLRVMGMDHVWLGTARQWAGRAAHRFYVDPFFDCALVPSDRTEFFAQRLGFHPADVIRGSYTADVKLFETGPRSGAELAERRSFLFAGRLAADKAPDVLAAAYRHYRTEAAQPWDLHVVGIGPMADVLAGEPGVVMHGFIQPVELAELMRSVSCFVLPSWAEHYGVVVHEAAAAALPLLVSHNAGSVPGLLQDGVNGRAVTVQTPQGWAEAMTWMSQAAPHRLEEMSAVSSALASRLSPEKWAQNVYEEFDRRLAKGGGRLGPSRAQPAMLRRLVRH